MSSYIPAVVILGLVLVGNVLGPDVVNISMRYYDSILHLLAGAGLGFFLIGLAGSFASLSAKFRKRSCVVLGVFVLGIIWELFEIYYNLSGYTLWTSLYYADTAKDLTLDFLGGSLSAFLMVKKNVR